MKPLLARFIPGLVSEQPLSAREERRLWRNLTGLDGALGTVTVEDEEMGEESARKTSVAEMVRRPERVGGLQRIGVPFRGSKSM